MLTFTPASLGSLVFFCLLLVAVLFFAVLGVYRGAKRLNSAAPQITILFVICLAVWLALSAAAVASGAIRQQPMPLLPFFIMAELFIAVLFTNSPIGKCLVQGVSLTSLVAFQSFRLPLEFILHVWVQQGVIPETMTWTGRNFDIIAGGLALVTAPFIAKMPKLAWLPNLVGIALLLNVMRVAILSAPLPFAWPVEPPMQLPFYLPYALIIPVCIGGALAGHIILTRRLMLR